MNFSPLKNILKEKKKILLTSHTNPDGDAVGSLLGMSLFLTRQGHEVEMLLPDRFPEYLSWLPGASGIRIYGEGNAFADELFGASEVLIALDYNDTGRLDAASEAMKSSQAVKVLIDHHADPDRSQYDQIYSTIHTSSTAEIVFEIISFLDKRLIDKDIATCLFTGILTDTGSFTYGCDSPGTFNVVAELVGTGISPSNISRLVYGNFSESRMRLLGYSISEKLKVLPEFCTAYISLTNDELKRFKYSKGDTEGVVNYALSLKGVRFAALFLQRKDRIRISFRSKGDFPVNEFARKHYQGGGHKNAAGGDSFESMDDTILQFEKRLSECTDQLCSN